MRAAGGRVPWLERHLDRLCASAAALELAPMPDRAEMRRAVAQTLAAAGPGPARVRLVATPRPTLLVEAAPEAPPSREPAPARAISLRGAWLPGDRAAEHKSLSRLGLGLAQRRAAAAGVEHALLLDEDGRLGEAAVASAFCRRRGRVTTAPARGLLPGIARAFAIGLTGAVEEVPEERDWRAADEIVLTNAVRGALALVEVDARPVGDGRPGPLARELAAALADAWG